jgi:Hypothetical glycosyl hydrolase family 15
VDKHRFFILSGSDAEVQATGYPAGVTWLEAFRQELTAAGRGSEKINEYVESHMTMGPASAMLGVCPASYEGFTTTWTSRPGDFCTKVDPNESWFLHNGNGIARANRIYRSAGSNNYYMMNVGNPGWRTFVVSKVPEIAADYDMDGIFLDDVWQYITNFLSREDNVNGVLAEYSTHAAWQAAYRPYLQGIKNALGARPLGMNSDDEGGVGYVQIGDYFMVENFLASWGTSYMPASEILQVWDDLDAALDRGQQLLLIGQGNGPTETLRMRFAHAGYLMFAGPGVFFRYHNAGIYRNVWDWPEFSWELGAPSGGRFAVGVGWRRNFANGTAIVNISDSASQVFDLGGSYRTPDGAVVSSVTLGPKQGMALRGL